MSWKPIAIIAAVTLAVVYITFNYLYPGSLFPSSGPKMLP